MIRWSCSKPKVKEECEAYCIEKRCSYLRSVSLLQQTSHKKEKKINIIAMAWKKDTLRRADKWKSPCPSHLRREEKKTDGEISLEMEKFFGFRPFGQEW